MKKSKLSEKIFNPDLGNNLLNKIDDWVYKIYYADSKSWYYHDENDNYHRLNAPAIIWDDGRYMYFFHNKWHRLHGYQSSVNDYWIMDKKYSEEEYWKHPDVIAYCKENNITNEFINNNSVKNELTELRNKLNHIIEKL